jgi:cytochrome c
MFDTMTVTKTAAALCGALLVLLLGQWVADELYKTEVYGEASYVIDTGDDEAEEEVVEVNLQN